MSTRVSWAWPGAHGVSCNSSVRGSSVGTCKLGFTDPRASAEQLQGGPGGPRDSQVKG